MYVTVCVGVLAESWTSLDIISMYQFDGLRIRGMSIEALQFLVRFLYSTFTFLEFFREGGKAVYFF